MVPLSRILSDIKSMQPEYIELLIPPTFKEKLKRLEGNGIHYLIFFFSTFAMAP